MISDEKLYFINVRSIKDSINSFAPKLNLKDFFAVYKLAIEICTYLNSAPNPENNTLIETKRIIFEVLNSLLIINPDAEFEVIEVLRQERNRLGYSSFEEECCVARNFIFCLISNQMLHQAQSIREELIQKLDEYEEINPQFAENQKFLQELIYDYAYTFMGENTKKKYLKPEPTIRQIISFMEDTKRCSNHVATDKLIPYFYAAQQIIFFLEIPDEWREEVQRQFAEIKLKLFIERNTEFSQTKSIYNQILDLGFRSFDREATIGIYFAEYCLHKKKQDEAKAILLEQKTNLEQGRELEQKEYHQPLKQKIETLLAQISDSN